jgi:cytoskeletal protein RodZ
MSHPDDELLSALLDGEAPSGDVAHADGCAQCQSRLSELRRATLVTASVVLPPAHVREAAVATAIRTLDEAPRQTSGARRLPPVAAAAVLLVALAVGGLLISQLGRDASPARDTKSASLAQGLVSTTARAQERSAPAADSAATLATPSNMSGAATAGGPTGPYDAGELGTVSAIDEIVKRAAADLDQPASVQAEHAMTDASLCPAEPDAGATLWQATLTFQGEAAVARAVEAQTGRVMRILRRADCSLLASRDF